MHKFWNLRFQLLRKNLMVYLLGSGSFKRIIPIKQVVCAYSKPPQIYLVRITFQKNHFRSNVMQAAHNIITRKVFSLKLDVLVNSLQSQVPILIYENVLQTKVTIKQFHLLQFLQNYYQLPNVKIRQLL
jgi:hypothetical protein